MINLIAKVQKNVIAAICPLVRLGGLVCLRIQQIGHAKAVNSNFKTQLKRSSFATASIKILCCLIALTIGTFAAGAVELVKDGKPLAEIVIPEKPMTPQLRYAAEELRDHIKKMSGAELAIVTAPSGKFKTLVHVGETEATKQAGISVSDLKKEGFRIVAKGDNLYIVGRDMPSWPSIPRMYTPPYRKEKLEETQKWWKEYTGENWEPPFSMMLSPLDYDYKTKSYSGEGCGTLFGIYEFLEQRGVRWYMPDAELGTVIPETKDIVIADGETKKEPLLAYRELYVITKLEPAWGKRLRLGGSTIFWCNHSLNHITNPEGEKHPEYLDTINGKPDTKGCGGEGRQLLISPELQKAMTKYLDKCFEAFPELEYGAVGDSDGYGFAGEIATKAGWDRTDRGQPGRMSDYFWGFLTRVAADVAKKYPDKYVMGLAYSAHRLFPSNMEKLPENVAVTYCQSRVLGMMPARQNELGKDRDEWLNKMSNKEFFIWDYYLIHNRNQFPPFPVIFTKLQQTEAKKLYGRIKGEMIECAYLHKKDGNMIIAYPGLNHLTYYLQSKLYWDKDLDLNALMQDYCEKFYGPAKKEMREFFDFAEAVWMRPESRNLTQTSGFLKPADVDKYFDILAKAKAKTGDSVYGKRIDLIVNEMEPLKKIFDKLVRTGPTLRAFVAEEAPLINGEMDKPFWNRDIAGNIIGSVPMRDLVTGELPAANKTNVSFRWLKDNSALVIGVTCYESRMDALKAKVSKRDEQDIFNDDNVEIYIETPETSYVKMAVNSNGSLWDECTQPSIEQPDPVAWSSGAKVAVKKYKDRWAFEILIPAAALGAKPTEHMPWGINVCRQRIAAGSKWEFYAISPTGKEAFAVLNRMANLYAD
jgi:hypothetical protein